MSSIRESAENFAGSNNTFFSDSIALSVVVSDEENCKVRKRKRGAGGCSWMRDGGDCVRYNQIIQCHRLTREFGCT